MKRTLLLLAATCALAPFHGNAQNPAVPPPLTPPSPPAPPSAPSAPPVERSAQSRPEDRNQSGVFLGVETVRLPAALSDQLNLPEGFGLLVDYVVPGSAADAAGVKTHDILKMLNDQILTSEGQLSTLVRSFSEGQSITLMVLRKGQENKLTATLQKRQTRVGDHESGRKLRLRRDEESDEFDGDFHLDLDELSRPEYADRIRESVERGRAQADAAMARANEQYQRAMETVRERTTRATGSRLDFDDAHILLRDSTGRIEIRSSHHQRTLTIRDADGKKVFEGPIDTPEQRKAIPADFVPQVEALERDQVITFPKRNGKDGDTDADGH